MSMPPSITNTAHPTLPANPTAPDARSHRSAQLPSSIRRVSIRQVRLRRAGAVAAFALLSVAVVGCSNQDDSTSTPTTAAPSVSPTSLTPDGVQQLTLQANERNCDLQPLIVQAGQINITATSTSQIPISVELFAPQDGAFTNRIARIRILQPGATKQLQATLTQGAYEIACGTDELTSRKRLTAL